MTYLEERLADAFVALGGAEAQFDAARLPYVLARRCAELLTADGVGVLLADPDGTLRAPAASHESVRVLQLVQLTHDEGPALDAYRTGEQVRCADLRRAGERWPVLVTAAAELGFVAVYSVPMRCQEVTLGALSVFSRMPGEPESGEGSLAQALSDVAATAIVNGRRLSELRTRIEQLQVALGSRVVLEQAKGVLAERYGIGMEQAFAVLREYARTRNVRLPVVARAVIDRSPAVEGLGALRPSPVPGGGLQAR